MVNGESQGVGVVRHRVENESAIMLIFESMLDTDTSTRLQRSISTMSLAMESELIVDRREAARRLIFTVDHRKCEQTSRGTRLVLFIDEETQTK